MGDNIENRSLSDRIFNDSYIPGIVMLLVGIAGIVAVFTIGGPRLRPEIEIHQIAGVQIESLIANLVYSAMVAFALVAGTFATWFRWQLGRHDSSYR